MPGRPVRLLDQAGRGRWARTEAARELRSLFDQNIEIVHRLGVVAKLEAGIRPGEPGIRVVGFCRECGFCSLQGGGGALSGREWWRSRGNAYVDQRDSGIWGKLTRNEALADIAVVGGTGGSRRFARSAGVGCLLVALPESDERRWSIRAFLNRSWALSRSVAWLATNIWASLSGAPFSTQSAA